MDGGCSSERSNARGVHLVSEPAKEPTSIFHVLKAIQTQAKPAIWGASGVALFWGLYSEWNDRGKPSSFLLHAHDIMARSGIRNRSDAQRAREALVADGVITATEFSQKQGLWRFELHLESLTSERVTHPYQTVSEPSGDGKEVVTETPVICDAPVTESVPPLGTEKEETEGDKDTPSAAAAKSGRPGVDGDTEARMEVYHYLSTNAPHWLQAGRQYDEFKDHTSLLGYRVCLYAAEITIGAGHNDIRYCLKILRDWREKGILTLAAAQAEQKVGAGHPRAAPGGPRRVATGGRGANLPRDAPRAVNQVQSEPIVNKWVPTKKGGGHADDATDRH